MQLIEPTKGFIFYSIIWNKNLLEEAKVRELLPGFDNVFYPKFNPSLRYYSKEMGEEVNLSRMILFNFALHNRDLLVEFKLKTQKIEDEFKFKNMRLLNIDPGLLTLENMILSTSKNFSHRLYLGQKVFGNLELIFKDNCLQKLPWSYDDYTSEEKIEFFMWLRSRLQATFI